MRCVCVATCDVNMTRSPPKHAEILRSVFYDQTSYVQPNVPGEYDECVSMLDLS